VAEENREAAHAFCKTLEAELVERHGYVVGGDALRRVLSLPSLESLRQAAARDTLPVPTFKILHRRGRFALARDLACWLAASRFGIPVDALAAPTVVAAPYPKSAIT
jgi:hypothetical protein